MGCDWKKEARAMNVNKKWPVSHIDHFCLRISSDSKIASELSYIGENDQV